MDGANIFESVGLSESGLIHSKNVREKASLLYQALMETPQSRERSLAITYLENAVMWANKGLSRNP